MPQIRLKNVIRGEAMIDYETLQSAVAQGIINLDAIQLQIEMHDREKYLKMHHNLIWQGKNGFWYTELPAKESCRRRLVKKSQKDDLEEEIINFYRTDEMHPPVKKVFKEWLAEKQEWGEIGNTTVNRYKGEFERFFGDTKFPQMRIDLIDDDYMEALIKTTIVNKELTAKSYSSMKTLLIGIMKQAKRKKYTEFSVSSFFGDLQISRKTFRRPEKKKQVFTDEEAFKVIDWLKKHPTVGNYGVLLVFQTGLREGELAALKYEDVEGCILNIRRQEIRYKNEKTGKYVNEVVPYTKSEAGERGVILTEEALKIIRKIRMMNPFGEYMMMENGVKIKKASFNDYLYKACRAVGIPPMSMHKIRKTYGTMLIDSGVTDSTIMEQMGHADITTTRKYYYFSQKNQAEKIEEVRSAISL